MLPLSGDRSPSGLWSALAEAALKSEWAALKIDGGNRKIGSYLKSESREAVT
ncbi:hypothetical protein [Sinorhizobium sp. CCBAU 05631]|uniref:hypothetical protein n=1 Tax=Sinorhizobium sp. CCBAU 05631 TaxID=794846 RepID=UPI0004BC4E87|nr:hypothetical protein [Sinorhizobium sp. CCBAU 05631]ASY56968.1 hypothetical protein SS05631_c20360 [Sinorhizobium sp. CCBAU 05631]